MIELLTVAEVAEQLKVSPQWVRDHSSRRHPLLPVIRFGSLLRFDKQKIRDFMESPPTTTLKEEGGMERNDEPKRAGGRPRGQEGYLEERGKKVKRWIAHWYVYELDENGKEVRKKRSRVIGRKPGGSVNNMAFSDAQLPEMNKWEAGREMKKIIDREVGIVRGPAARASSSVSFGWFAVNRWLPTRESAWRPSTRSTNLQILNSYILPRWEKCALRELDNVAVAKWLAEMSQSFSSTIVQKCRTYMKAIVTEAVEQEYLQRDPLRRLILPRMAQPDRPTISPSQIRSIVQEIEAFRDQVIFLTLVLTGMRPSEVFALKWRDWHRNVLYVVRGVVQGKVSQTKTRSSTGKIAVPEYLGNLLEVWRSESQPVDNEAWIFPSENQTPLRLDNWVKRYLRPAADRAGVKVTAQMLRRTFATIAHEEGVSMKAVQGQLRHASMNTTSNIYTQIPDGAQLDAVEKVASKVLNGAPRKKD